MLSSDPFDGDAIVSLAEARVECRLTADDTFHDAKVISARDRAIAWAERVFGHSLQEREFVWAIDTLCEPIRLPRVPVTSVDAISYYAAGVDTALDEADWTFGGDRVAAAYGTTWPSADGTPYGVRVTFTAGYGLVGDIPPNLMGAVLMATLAFFEGGTDPDLRGALRCGGVDWVPTL